MRVVFLYTNNGCTASGAWLPWSKEIPTKEFYAVDKNGIVSEGYFTLLKALLKKGVFSELLIVIESSRSPGGTYVEDIPCVVIPHMEYLPSLLKEDDVIFARGGFRSWHDILMKLKGKHWLLLYGANAGRERWEWWDIILSDLSEVYQIDKRGRCWVRFYKPTNPELFFPYLAVKPMYDICIGASHVHDRKAQWKGIDILIAAKKVGINLKAILPGSIKRGEETNLIITKIEKHGLDVTLPGMVSRTDLQKIFNQSALTIFCGESGQNDRGPLESLSCGTPVMISNPGRHDPFLSNTPQISSVFTNSGDPRQSLQELVSFQASITVDRFRIAELFREQCGFSEVCVPAMSRLFQVLKENPTPSKEVLRNEYGREINNGTALLR